MRGHYGGPVKTPAGPLPRGRWPPRDSRNAPGRPVGASVAAACSPGRLPLAGPLQPGRRWPAPVRPCRPSPPALPSRRASRPTSPSVQAWVSMDPYGVPDFHQSGQCLHPMLGPCSHHPDRRFVSKRPRDSRLARDPVPLPDQAVACRYGEAIGVTSRCTDCVQSWVVSAALEGVGWATGWDGDSRAGK